MLDVSRGAATKLGFRHAGVARLIVKIVKAPTPAEARYRARRTYAPVPGYIGRFDSIAAALAASGYGGGGDGGPREAPQQVADLLWATHAANATPVLPAPVIPAMVEPGPAPLPEQPSLAFRQQLRKLAMAERRRQANELRRLQRAQRVALAATKAKQEAEEKRKRATTAKKTKQQTALQSGTAKQAPAGQVAAARAGQSGAAGANLQRSAQAQSQGQGASASPQATSGAPVAPRQRTVWRR